MADEWFVAFGGGVVGAVAAVAGEAIWKHLHAANLRSQIQVNVPKPICARMLVVDQKAEEELPSEIGEEQRRRVRWQIATADSMFTVQPRVENGAGSPLLDCVLYLSLDHSFADIASAPWVSDERVLPIINPGSEATVQKDRLCWSFDSGEIQNPHSIHVLPEESQPFELCRILVKHKLLCFPSEHGWKRPRIWLRADKQYRGQITLISASIRSRTFDLVINALEGSDLAASPVSLTPRKVCQYDA